MIYTNTTSLNGDNISLQSGAKVDVATAIHWTELRSSNAREARTGRVVSDNNWHERGRVIQLASCLVNAQPLPAHSPAADDNSLIGCTSHDLTDDWSLASTHFAARLGAFFY